MASTSASSIQKSFKYDVFISFRGEDTRKNFVDHLYHALQQKNIISYKDDKEIKKGKRISDELFKSIEESKFYIIGFSKNYASSSWCLDELVKIMECQKTNEHTAYPVFYDVEPSEVRKQNGVVGEAFVKYKEEDVEKWREALRGAANLAGWELKNTLNGHEAEFIQKIVEDVSLDLRFINLSIDGKIVGMKKRVKDVVSSLEIDNDDVRIIGIKGIGGGGKTTLARAVFDQISFRFEGSSFVENVREISKNPMCGLKSLQKQVLSDVLNKQDIIVNGVYEGKKMMKLRMCVRKVLVVLDDVDHIDQLEALAGEPSWFKIGSRIIITTREEQVLVAHRVPKNLILDVNLLSHKEATCLFNKYAFGREIANQGYEILSDQVVRYAAGLPLTIRVLGSFLCGKDELEWIDALERLKTIPLKETLEILEISYNSLEEDYKEIFLDVACMLKGWDKELAIIALECCEFHAINGLRVLEQKSLVTISHSGRLDMHDHIEEMGKNIIRRLQPNEPHKHSRLWIQDEISDILIKGKGTKVIRCMKVRNVNPVILMKGLRKMKELRFLDVIIHEKEVDYFDDYDLNYINIDADSLYLSKGLQYLQWDGYPFRCLPTNFQANNLVGLKMRLSNIDQLWEGGQKKVLKKLRFIDLSFCKLRFLDIGLIPNLERLTIVACKNLVEICMPAENFKLKSLTLRSSMIRTLNIGRALHLEQLIIKDNDNLVELHFPTEKLKRLHLRCCKIKTLNLMRTWNLQRLDLEQCEDLLELHMPVENPKLETIKVSRSKLRTLNLIGARNLERLDLEQCEDLVELDMPCESPSLKIIKIYYSMLRNLNLTGIRNLEMLALENCEELLELHMSFENPKLETIKVSGSKIRTLDLSGTDNLKWLYLEQCESLLELHMPFECPKLKTIKVSGSNMRTLDIMGTQNLKWLDIVNCEDLLELHMPIESPHLETIRVGCSKLRTLNLAWNQYLKRIDLEQCENLLQLHMPIKSPKLETIKISRSKMRTLDLTGTRNLNRLDLKQCEDLVELHMPIASPGLKIINIFCSKLRTINLTGTRNLERLVLEQCEDLVELHMPIESPKLKTIKIRNSKLRTVYLGLSPNLECLDLHDCFNLVEIHAPIGCQSGCVRFKPILVNQGFPMVGSLSELHLIVRSLGVCSLHPDNYLPKFHFECIYKELAPASTRNLEKLMSFGLCACTNLAGLSGTICGLQCLRKLTLEGSIPELPKEIDQLEFLEELTLLSANIEYLPDSICTLNYLEFLRLESCCFLKQLPENIGRLECLEELHLTNCTSLQDIPNSICEMKCLKCFYLTNCILVEKLPKDMGRLTCLKELNIEGTGITDPPESIFQLEDLRLFV